MGYKEKPATPYTLEPKQTTDKGQLPDVVLGYFDNDLKCLVAVVELYDELDIQNGTMAIEAWGKTIFEDVADDKKEEIRSNLLKYCELDTLAMVKILDKLKNKC